jgi:hypothetical protein
MENTYFKNYWLQIGIYTHTKKKKKTKKKKNGPQSILISFWSLKCIVIINPFLLLNINAQC